MKHAITLLYYFILGWLLNDVWQGNKHQFFGSKEPNRYQSFDFFYTHFATDSTFQEDHIKLPLNYSEIILEKLELYKKESLNHWEYIDLPMSLDTNIYDNFDRILSGNRRLLELNNSFYYFEFIDDDWYLIRIEKYI